MNFLEKHNPDLKMLHATGLNVPKHAKYATGLNAPKRAKYATRTREETQASHSING